MDPFLLATETALPVAVVEAYLAGDAVELEAAVRLGAAVRAHELDVPAEREAA